MIRTNPDLVKHHRHKIGTVGVFLRSRVAGADGEILHLAIADDVAGAGRKGLRLGVGVAEDIAGAREGRAVRFRFARGTGSGKIRILQPVQARQASLRAQGGYFFRNQIFGLASFVRRQLVREILDHIHLATNPHDGDSDRIEGWIQQILAVVGGRHQRLVRVLD